MTNDPHTEPLAVYEHDGLALPEAYIGYEGGLVVRTPKNTQQYNGWWGDAFVGSVRPDHFGDYDYNPELAPDCVQLKKYGEEPEVFRVAVDDE